MAKSPFRKGAAGLEKRSGSSDFISVAADESIQIAFLENTDDMLSADMHEFWEVNPFISFPCIGKGCPGCELGNPGKFKAYMLVLSREGQAKIYSFGITVARQLSEIEEELGALKGKVFRIKRSGSGLKTKYQAIPLGKSVAIPEGLDIPDIVSKLGPTTRDEIVELLVQSGLMEEPEKPVTRKKAEKPEAPAKRSKKAEEKLAVDEEDEDDELPWTTEEDDKDDEGWDDL